MKLSTYITLLLIIPIGCSHNGKTRKKTAPVPSSSTAVRHIIRIEQPSGGTLFTYGESIPVALSLTDTLSPDSVIVSAGSAIRKLTGLSTAISSNKLTIGSNRIKVTAWKNGQPYSEVVTIRVKPDSHPKQYSYRIVRSYPHDPKAYTQGLFYHNGYLYEGTGQNGASSLRKIELTTGKVVQSLNISQQYFGEGIALLNGKIYQLTWRSGIGFVYDLASFNMLHSFGYSTQGWGLTANDRELVMSDGSNIVRFMEPDGFSEVKHIEVYDNEGPVQMLNELEYYKGMLLANIYLTDRIAMINPENGEVKGYINLKGLLKSSERNGNEDVLNGIAYDSQNDRLFVTGKYWPKLFEIRLIK